MTDTFGVPKPGQNTGLIIEVRPLDFYVGAASAAVRTPLLVDGQYDTHLPDEETQFKWNPQGGLDTFACVTFSALDCLETIFTTYIDLKLFSTAQMNFLRNEGYIDKNTGKVNFSDRYTAKLSGTTLSGNTFGNVGDSIRKLHGLIPELDWPWPAEFNQQMYHDEAWNLYYKPIPPELIAKGLRFLQMFSINYEYIVLQGVTADPKAAIRAALPYGPVQIASLICAPWNSTEAAPPIPGCGCGSQHATEVYGYTNEGAWKDFDSYKSFKKLLAPDYCITYALQYHVVTPAAQTFTRDLTIGSQGPDVKALQKFLNTHGFIVAPTGTGSPGQESDYFGSLTRAAVAKFQAANGISPAVGYFGPVTRAKVNSL